MQLKLFLSACCVYTVDLLQSICQVTKQDVLIFSKNEIFFEFIWKYPAKKILHSKAPLKNTLCFYWTSLLIIWRTNWRCFIAFFSWRNFFLTCKWLPSTVRNWLLSRCWQHLCFLQKLNILRKFWLFSIRSFPHSSRGL